MEIKEKIFSLTEEADPQERESLIRRATASDQITFLTKTFGRGTDFICNDQVVIENDGVHVLQTFISEDNSEEVQIRGRTARQGGSGSYSMVLLDTSLEKFLITKEDLEKVKRGVGVFSRVFSAVKMGPQVYSAFYELINDRRNDLFESQYAENKKFVDDAEKQHAGSLVFLKAIETNDLNAIKQFLLSENKGVAELNRSRTIVLMDATISMSQLLHKAKTTVRTMFERTCDILKDHKINQDSFQIQFVVYRNYNCEEDKLLQSSPWETKPDNLRTFMEKIGAEGGWVNEAIEVGLWHVNREIEKGNVSQVILIGDAPANTQEDVIFKRASKGENYWSKTRFAKMAVYSKEIVNLQQNNVPIHAFYVAEFAKRNFQEIANLTGGRCEPLDINSSAGAVTLTNLVTEVLLSNIGQQNGKGDALVDAYRNKFIKSYNNRGGRNIFKITDNNS